MEWLAGNLAKIVEKLTNRGKSISVGFDFSAGVRAQFNRQKPFETAQLTDSECTTKTRRVANLAQSGHHGRTHYPTPPQEDDSSAFFHNTRCQK